jgi:UDP-N-acetylglucosamine--N-acetylmuramyl-(pentapeptide) pyrophosphoryl-undecaprenol N-acetylglucosamine transferase
LVEGRERKILIAGGGTGGHLFPALAVADELSRRWPGSAITFVGSKHGLETKLVPRAGYALRVLPLSGIKGVSWSRRILAAGAAAWGIVRCAGWMVGSGRPDLVIGVGGYASGPSVLAAKLLGVKTMIMEQNHFPGATNRWLSPRVDAVCVPSIAARNRLGRGIVTGNPVRAEFSGIGEPPAGPVLSLLVFGGSRGARSINRAMVEALPHLSQATVPPRIVHQTGIEEESSVASAYRDYPAGGSEVRAFLDDMPARLQAADLVVCRAGATTLAELAAAGRPAILVPYPHAADDHQTLNARAVEEAGAAESIRDEGLDGKTLAARILSLAADPERRIRMARAARGLAVPDATSRIADVVGSLLEEGGRDVP